MGEMVLITPKITNLGYSNLWTDMSTILGYASNFAQQIQKLFANGEQGFFYDPNDLSTMFQDAAGTIPITAAGQPVGLMKDKSGRNNHASQTVSSSRPILQRNATTGAYYLVFDGVDDFFITNSIDFTATDKVSLFAGVRKLSDAATGIICELSNNSDLTVSGVFRLSAPAFSGASKYAMASRGDAAIVVQATTTDVSFNAPNSSALTAKAQISNDSVLLRVNGSQVELNTADQGKGNYGNYSLYIGRRGGISLPLNGHLYSLIGIGRLTSDSETIALEKAIAKNVGVTLNV